VVRMVGVWGCEDVEMWDGGELFQRIVRSIVPERECWEEATEQLIVHKSTAWL
jgi:hypothetical protein